MGLFYGPYPSPSAPKSQDGPGSLETPPLVNDTGDNGRPGRRGPVAIPKIRTGGTNLNDANHWLSKPILIYTAVSAGLNLASSVRTRGIRRSVYFFALGTGLPAVGELLATGPLKLLRHRMRYRIAGVPLGILLGWYGVIHGSFVVAERVS